MASACSHRDTNCNPSSVQQEQTTRRASLNATATPFVPQWRQPSMLNEPLRCVTSPEPFHSRRPSFSVDAEMAASAWLAQQNRIQESLTASALKHTNLVEWDFGGYEFEPPLLGKDTHIMIDVPLIHPPGINYSIAPTAELSNILYYDSNGFGFPSPLSTPTITSRGVDPWETCRSYHTRFVSVDYSNILPSEPHGTSPDQCLVARRSSGALEGCHDPEVDYLADLNKITDVRYLSGSIREASNKRGISAGPSTPPMTNPTLSSPISPTSTPDTPLLTPQLESMPAPLSLGSPVGCNQNNEASTVAYLWGP